MCIWEQVGFVAGKPLELCFGEGDCLAVLHQSGFCSPLHFPPSVASSSGVLLLSCLD